MNLRYLLYVTFAILVLSGCSFKYDTFTVPNGRPRGYIKFYCNSWMPGPLLIKQIEHDKEIQMGKILTNNIFMPDNITIEREPGIYKFEANIIVNYSKSSAWQGEFVVNVIADANTPVMFSFPVDKSNYDFTTRSINYYYKGNVTVETPVPVGR